MSDIIKNYDVNGLSVEARYSKDMQEHIALPLLKKLSKLYEEKQRRIVVFLAAPPACGKTTLSLYLQDLSRTHKDLVNVQALSMDGYHYHQNYILSHSVHIDGKETEMLKVKGCPETFDLSKLKNKIMEIKEKNSKWPIYDRHAHDVCEDAIEVREHIILIEGNYLLLDEENWRDLKQLADYTIFIKGDERLLKTRLVQRKMMGGSLLHLAVRFYEESDHKNIIRVLHHQQSADLLLSLDENQEYHN